MKTKVQISDECVSYYQYLKDNLKRLVNVACVYPNVSYFKNSIFVKPGGVLLINNDLVKLVEEDNSTVTEEGFFLSSKVIENNMNEKLEVKINVRKQDLYGHNICNHLCYEQDKILENLTHLLNDKNKNHIYTNRNYKQIQVMDKPVTPKMDVFQLMESSESVPLAQSFENVVSKPKITISTPTVQKPKFLKNPQFQNFASTSEMKPAVVITKPIQKSIVVNFKAKQIPNLVKRKIPFVPTKLADMKASTARTKQFDTNVTPRFFVNFFFFF